MNQLKFIVILKKNYKNNDFYINHYGSWSYKVKDEI